MAATPMKLLIDLQGEIRVEHLEMPDGSTTTRQVYVPTEKLVPLSADELAQQEVDAAAAELNAAAAAAAADDRRALLVKLSAGEASDREVQAAVAALLGGDSSPIP